MIYLQQFNTTAEYNSAKNDLTPPNVAWDKESGEIYYMGKSESGSSGIPNNEIHYTATEKLAELQNNQPSTEILGPEIGPGIGIGTELEPGIGPELGETNPSTSLVGINVNAFNTTINLHSFTEGYGIITFNDSVTTIGNNAFKRCGFTSVIMPNSVTSIGNQAFLDCSSLTSITIPNSVTSIGGYAFQGCSNLTSITYTGTQRQWHVISKGMDWRYGVSTAVIVHCTDGDIAIANAD